MNGVRFLVLIGIWTPCLAKNSPGIAPKNLALNKNSSQSTIVRFDGFIEFSPSRANDGDMGTRAITYNTTPSWWFVDLKEQIRVTFVLIKLEQPWTKLRVGVGNNKPTSSGPGQDFNVCKKFTRFPGDWIQTIGCNFTGQYVIVISDDGGTIAINEVEVYNTTEPGDLGIGQLDLARNKKSYLSSTSNNNHASYGNDGKPTTKALNDVYAPPPVYWYVDLERHFQVTSIVLYNTGDWTDLTVGVGDNPLTNRSRPDEDFRVCHVFTGYPGDTLHDITCKESGRYVIIFNNAFLELKVKEIEVYGTPVAGTTENYPITTVTTKNTEVAISMSSFFISKEPEARSTNPLSLNISTTTNPDEKKHDWMYILFSVLFFVLLPPLGLLVWKIRKAKIVEDAKVDRLAARRNSARRRHAEFIEFKNSRNAIVSREVDETILNEEAETYEEPKIAQSQINLPETQMAEKPDVPRREEKPRGRKTLRQKMPHVHAIKTTLLGKRKPTKPASAEPKTTKPRQTGIKSSRSKSTKSNVKRPWIATTSAHPTTSKSKTTKSRPSKIKSAHSKTSKNTVRSAPWLPSTSVNLTTFKSKTAKGRASKTKSAGSKSVTFKTKPKEGRSTLNARFTDTDAI